MPREATERGEVREGKVGASRPQESSLEALDTEATGRHRRPRDATGCVELGKTVLVSALALYLYLYMHLYLYLYCTAGHSVGLFFFPERDLVLSELDSFSVPMAWTLVCG